MGVEVVFQAIRGDLSVGKQTRSCLEFCREQGWHVSTMVPAAAVSQTIRLVEDDPSRVVVMAYVNAHSLSIEEQVVAAGGRVAYCRAPEGRLASDAVDTGGVIVFLYRKGRPVDAIAEILDVAAERVRRTLLSRGVRRLRE